MKLRDHPLTAFLDAVASEQPVPGGGSVAALVGALAASLASMVARLTVNRGDAGQDLRMQRIIGDGDDLRRRLEEAIDLDAESYAAVMVAYRLAKGTEAEKEARRQAVQAALRGAATVPLAVARMALDALRLLEDVTAGGNRNAVTDGLVGAMAARTAVLGALLNVRINLASIADASFREEILGEVERMEGEARAAEEAVIATGASRMEEAG